MIELLRQHGVTPVLVFDGAPPAMKARLNEERRAQRAAHRAKADALLAQGKRAEAVHTSTSAPPLLRTSTSAPPHLRTAWYCRPAPPPCTSHRELLSALGVGPIT